MQSGSHFRKTRGPALMVMDLDGTLADSSDDLANALNVALASRGLLPLTKQKVLSMVGEGSMRLVGRALDEVGGDKSLIDEVHDLFLATYSEHLVDSTRLYPGVEETLPLLSEQALLAVFSNKALRYVEPIIEALGISEHFSRVMGSDWGGPRKPDGAGLLRLCGDLEVSPSEGVMVGDGTTDILAGKAAGMYTVAVTYGFRSQEELSLHEPDLLCHRFSDLLGITGYKNETRGDHES